MLFLVPYCVVDYWYRAGHLERCNPLACGLRMPAFDRQPELERLWLDRFFTKRCENLLCSQIFCGDYCGLSGLDHSMYFGMLTSVRSQCNRGSD